MEKPGLLQDIALKVRISDSPVCLCICFFFFFSETMHELFEQVLGHRDLSKAGDLFSLEDKDIEDDLSAVLQKIQEISSSSDYQKNINDQSVVEISINRVTAAIR